MEILSVFLAATVGIAARGVAFGVSGWVIRGIIGLALVGLWFIFTELRRVVRRILGG